MENVVYSEVMDMYTNFFFIALRWVRFIYQNSEKQVEQNEKIIELLMEIKEQNEKESK